MPIRYCKLDEGTFVDRSGADSGANVLTGPAGMQAIIRGTSAAAATILAAGDTLYLQGTGDLTRLVDLDVGAACQNWSVGDRVRNDVGAGPPPVAGSQWNGVVVETNTGGYLANNNHARVWLEAGRDETDIIVASGVENQDALGGAGDPVNTIPIVGRSTPGIQNDGNAGTDGNRISFAGVDDLWVEDGTLATLAGGDIASYCLTLEGVHHFIWRSIELKEANLDNIYVAVLTQHYTFARCSIHDSNTGDGVGGTNQYFFVYLNTDIYSNAIEGIAGAARYGSLVGSRVFNNGGNGAVIQYSGGVHNCEFYGNGGYGLSLSFARARIISNSVFDSNGNSGIYITDGDRVVTNCRLTNNGRYGLEVSTATVFAQHNFFQGNALGATLGSTVRTHDKGVVDTNIYSGVDGYVLGPSHSSRDYGLTPYATGRRLDPDLVGTMRLSAGLPALDLPFDRGKRGGKQ